MKVYDRFELPADRIHVLLHLLPREKLALFGLPARIPDHAREVPDDEDGTIVVNDREMELAELQEKHETGQTDYLAKEQQLNDARLRLRELERAAQEAAHQPPRYVGRCARLTLDERRVKEAAGLKPVVRFRIGEGVVAFDDVVRSPARQA